MPRAMSSTNDNRVGQSIDLSVSCKKSYNDPSDMNSSTMQNGSSTKPFSPRMFSCCKYLDERTSERV